MTERMSEARAAMVNRGRTPRVYFLAPSDFDEFAAANPPTMRAAFHQGGRPTELEVLAFDGIAVRPCRATRGRVVSKLYCCIGTTRQLAIA